MVVIPLGSDTYELAENPLWWESKNSFLWVDIEQGNIYKYSLLDNTVECIISTSHRVGAFVLDQNDNILLFTEKGILRVKYNDSKYIIDSNYLYYYPLSGERFNDAICDRDGRIIAGIKSDDNSNQGRVVMFEKDNKVRVLLENIQISNGMGFSKDSRIFYHTDSLRKEICKYDYNIKLGKISNRRVLYKNTGFGVPDGMTVDTNNNIFTCIWDEGKILKIEPNHGKIIKEYLLPCKCCSSLIFGGCNLDKILVTSAKVSINKASLTTDDGKVFMIENISKGRLEYKAKIYD